MMLVLKDSLNLQDTCPICGASWKVIANSLQEPLSQNYYIARMILDNCDVCRIRFKEV